MSSKHSLTQHTDDPKKTLRNAKTLRQTHTYLRTSSMAIGHSRNTHLKTRNHPERVLRSATGHAQTSPIPHLHRETLEVHLKQVCLWEGHATIDQKTSDPTPYKTSKVLLHADRGHSHRTPQMPATIKQNLTYWRPYQKTHHSAPIYTPFASSENIFIEY